MKEVIPKCGAWGRRCRTLLRGARLGSDDKSIVTAIVCTLGTATSVSIIVNFTLAIHRVIVHYIRIHTTQCE